MPEGTIFEDNSNQQNNPPPQQQNSVPQQENIPEELDHQNPAPPQQPVVSEEPVIAPQPPVQSPPPPIPQDHSGGFPLKKIGIIIGVILFIVLVLIIGISFLSSRGGSGNNEQAVISYWGVNEDPQIMQSVIADFEKENPNIKVEYGKQDLSTYREKLSTRFENGTGPDVFTFHNSWYPVLSKDLQEIPGDVINVEAFKEANYDVVTKDLVVNDKVIGIPLGVDTLVLYVNPQIFQNASSESGKSIEVPKTWEEFIIVSNELTKRNDRGLIDIAGAGIGTYDNVEHAADIISLLLAQNGVDFNNLSESSNKIDDAIEFYTNFSQVENNVWDNTLDNTLLAFSQGKLAMFFGYASDYKKIKSLNPSLNFQVYPVPQLLNEEQVNLASYWAEGVSATSPNKEAAYKFISYLNKPEVQEKVFQEQSQKNGAYIPYSNKKLAEKLKDNIFAPVLVQINTAVSSPFISGTSDNGLNSRLSALLGTVVNNIIAREPVVASEVIPAEYELIIAEVTGQALPQQ